MVGTVSRSISEPQPVKGDRFESGQCCAESLLEDVIPFDHVSAGVCTVLCGMG